MSDHADVIRVALEGYYRVTGGQGEPTMPSLAALAALEQELTEAKRLLALRDDAYKSSMREEAIARAEAAEAERDALRKALTEMSMDMSAWDAAAPDALVAEREPGPSEAANLLLDARLELAEAKQRIAYLVAEAHGCQPRLAKAEEALRDIRDYYEAVYAPGDQAYQAAIIARAALAGEEGT